MLTSEQAFEAAIEFVLEREGGLVDDPNDSGGLTNYGISQRAYPRLDIRNLTRADAVQIYRSDYWLRCRCDELPAPLALLVFDSAVNQGPDAAIRALQAALGTTSDGVMGPQTITAAGIVALNRSIPELVARRMYAYGKNSKFVLDGLGWSRRLALAYQAALKTLEAE